MQIFIDTLRGYIITSLPIGIAVGFIYNTICILPKKIKNKKQFFFVTDFLFTLLLFLLFFVLSYCKNFGTYRAYSFAVIITVSLIYCATFGKLILQVEYIVANAFIKFFKYMHKNFEIAIDFSLKFVKIKIDNYRVSRYKRKLLALSKKGFPGKVSYGRESTKTTKK